MRIVITAPPDTPSWEYVACLKAALFAKDHAALGPKPGDVMLVSTVNDPTDCRVVIRRKTGVTVYSKGYTWD